MHRKLVVVVSALVTTLGVGTAWADAPENSNNSAGAFASELTPELTSGEPGSFGESRSMAGQEGTVGESEKAFTEALASCGTP